MSFHHNIFKKSRKKYEIEIADRSLQGSEVEAEFVVNVVIVYTAQREHISRCFSAWLPMIQCMMNILG